MEKIPVGVLAATGIVGQRFIQLLADHPWFEITAVAASERSAGKRYADAVHWLLPTPIPERVADMTVVESRPPLDCALVFSALPSDVAREVEPAFAEAGYVVSSNASAYRREPDVPLLIPEVNPDHLGLLPSQQKSRGWDHGCLVTNPNCSTITLVMALKPLVDAFGVEQVIVTTMQATSGAGYPGVPSLDVIDNVLPHTDGEEPKMEWEPLKLLGSLNGAEITLADLPISAHCHRVAVWDGHTEAVSVKLGRPATADELRQVLHDFRGLPQELGLPSAPERPLAVPAQENRPQPRLDRDAAGGMATAVGRIRPCPILDWKLLVVGHNTVRGAAGAAILNAELMKAQGYLS